MCRYVSRRSQTAGLIALVSLLTLARTSLAQTTRFEVGASTLSAGAASVTADPSHAQRASTADVDSFRMFRSTGRGPGSQEAARGFVECHISRHPLAGMRAAELACPLLFAEVETTSQSQSAGADSQNSAASPDLAN
jgi:hypothetical protein